VRTLQNFTKITTLQNFDNIFTQLYANFTKLYTILQNYIKTLRNSTQLYKPFYKTLHNSTKLYKALTLLQNYSYYYKTLQNNFTKRYKTLQKKTNSTQLCTTLQSSTQLYLTFYKNFPTLYNTLQHFYNTIHNSTQRYKAFCKTLQKFTKKTTNLNKVVHILKTSTFSNRTMLYTTQQISQNFTTNAKLYTILQNFTKLYTTF